MLLSLLKKLWYCIISQFVKEMTCTLYVTKAFFLQAGCIYHKTNKSLFWYKKVVVPVEHLVTLVYLIPSLHPTAKSLVIFFVYPITPNLSYLACQYLVISLDRLLDRYNITRQNYTPQNFRAETRKKISVIERKLQKMAIFWSSGIFKSPTISHTFEYMTNSYIAGKNLKFALGWLSKNVQTFELHYSGHYFLSNWGVKTTIEYMK